MKNLTPMAAIDWIFSLTILLFLHCQSDPPPPRPQRPPQEAFYEEGKKALEQNDYQEALRFFEKGLSTNSPLTRQKSRLEMSRLFLKFKNYEKALALLNQSSFLPPLQFEASALKGAIFWKQGKLKEALQLTNTAYLNQHRPLSVEIQRLAILKELGYAQQIEKRVDLLLKKKWSLSLVNLKLSLLIESNKLAEAMRFARETYYEKQVKLNPYQEENITFWRYCGVINLKHGQKSKALRLFSKILSVKPFDEKTLLLSAKIQMKEQTNQAVALLKSLMKINANNEEAYFFLGQIFYKQSKPYLARHYLKSYLKLISSSEKKGSFDQDAQEHQARQILMKLSRQEDDLLGMGSPFTNISENINETSL